MFFLLIPWLGIALVGIIYTSVATYDEIRKGELVKWRRLVALIGNLAVVIQAVLSAVMFNYIVTTTSSQRQDSSGARMMWSEFLVFLIALPCILTRKGLVRWWLLYSSIALVAFTGFAYLISGIVF